MDPWWKKKIVRFHFQQYLHHPPPSVVYQQHTYAVAVAIDCNVPFAAVLTVVDDGSLSQMDIENDSCSL